MTELVSCILPTRDRPHFVQQAIRCFLRQTYANSELLVADAGEAPVDELCGGLPRVRHIRLDPSATLGSQLNSGIEQAQGGILQKLDDDDYYHTDFLNLAVSRLRPGSIVAWDCFLVLFAGEKHLRHSGHGWKAGGTLCFHRDLWERAAFREVPRGEDHWFFEDTGASLERVCAPEMYIVVRHGGNTWHEVGGRPVDDAFRSLRPYRRPMSAVIDPADLDFYLRMCRA